MLLWGEPPGAGISRVQALAVFSLEALLIIPAWVWGPGKHGGGWRALGLRHRLTARMLGTTFLALIAVLIVNGLWEVARQALDLTGQPEILPDLFDKRFQAGLDRGRNRESHGMVSCGLEVVSTAAAPYGENPIRAGLRKS